MAIVKSRKKADWWLKSSSSSERDVLDCAGEWLEYIEGGDGGEGGRKSGGTLVGTVGREAAAVLHVEAPGSELTSAHRHCGYQSWQSDYV